MMLSPAQHGVGLTDTAELGYELKIS
jgi:hypothetical protein